MTVIDKRVVEMGFDNKQFEAGVDKSVKSVETLKESLKLEKSAKSLNDLSAAGRSFSLAGISDSVQAISNRFSAMGIVGMTVIANLTNSAINMGKRIFASIVTQPLMTGLQEYETQMNAIQTVLANTSSKGTTLLDVNKALDELNSYADKTIYNFSEMTKNIGTFTAAGITLETSVAAIKGIANLAAVSGSNAQQASTAMYQLSQALSSGTVKLMDWNSVVNAGMGGQVFQDALKETARVHGVAVDKIIADEGSFRESLSKGWLTSTILTETLSKLTGDLSAEQLKSMGYTEEQIVKIMALGKTASDAATKVKTLTQLKDTLKEAVQSGWAKSMQLVIGDFEQARNLFTGISDVLGAMIGESADTRNNILEQWSTLGGRASLIEGLGRAFKYLLEYMKPINQAMLLIFPPITGKRLAELSEKFNQFTKLLMPQKKVLAGLLTVARGVFSVFDIASFLIQKVAKYLLGFSGSVGSVVGTIGSYTVKVAEFLIELRRGIKFDNLLEKTFVRIVEYIKPAVAAIQRFYEKLKGMGAVLSVWKKKIVDYFAELFPKKIDLGGLERLTEEAGKRFGPLTTIFNVFKKVVTGIWNAVKKMAPVLDKIARFIANILSGVIDAISEAVVNLDFEKVFDVINGGMLTAILSGVRKFVSKSSGAFTNVDTLLGDVKGILDGVRSSIEAWQESVRSKTLLTIAIALGILAISLVGISMIDSEKLTRSLTAITVMFAQLMVSMSVLDKIGGDKKKITLMAGQILILSTAILIMSAAVANLARLDPEELTRGLTAVGGLMAMVHIFMRMASKVSKNALQGMGGLLVFTVALRMLVNVVKKLGEMDPTEIQKGLTALGVILLELVTFMKLTSNLSGGIKNSVAFILLAVSLTILAKALGEMGKLSWGEIVRGLVALSTSLLAISLAIKMLPSNTILIAAGLLVMSTALVVLAKALTIMGGMTWEEIARGIVALSGAIVVLSVGMKLMGKSLAGAAAFVVVSGALALLAPALKIIGSMSLKEIGFGLLALAGVFVVLGLAGLILGPLVPIIFALSAAVLVFGIGAAAIGAGLVLFATGLAAIGTAGTVALGGITTLIIGLVGLIPAVIAKIVEGIVSFVTNIVAATPLLITAFVDMVMSLIDGVVRLVPDVIKAVLVFVNEIFRVLVDNAPNFIDAGLGLIVALLEGLAMGIKDIVVAAVDLVLNFLDGVESKIPDIVQGAFDLIISFLDGLEEGIDENMPRLIESAGKLAGSLLEGIVDGLIAGVGQVISSVVEIGKSILDSLKDALGIQSPSKEAGYIIDFFTLGLTRRLHKNVGDVEESTALLGTSMLSALTDSIDNNLNISPTVRPVMDLSDIISGGQHMNDILGQGITIPTNLNQLTSSISSGTLQDTSQINPIPQTTSITFNQTNNSPKPLSSLEIYRQTRNQLSLLRGLGNG